MEIISIPLEGDLEHKDSIGNAAVIKEGDVQAMSAGTGVFHSEYNKNNDREVKFLQIWVYPRERNVTPRYDQVTIKDLEKPNELYQVLSPNKDDDGVWVHQDAWIHIGTFDKPTEVSYEVKKPGNGVYAFVLDGDAEIADHPMSTRDAVGVWDTENFTLKAQKGTRVLLMEVPMRLPD